MKDGQKSARKSVGERTFQAGIHSRDLFHFKIPMANVRKMQEAMDGRQDKGWSGYDGVIQMEQTEKGHGLDEGKAEGVKSQTVRFLPLATDWI